MHHDQVQESIIQEFQINNDTRIKSFELKTKAS